MADNAIDVIREAEMEAEKTLLLAAQEGKRIKEEAIAEVARAGKLCEAAAKAAAAGTVSAAREKSGRVQREAEASLEKELEALRRKTEGLREKAIGAVIDALV